MRVPLPLALLLASASLLALAPPASADTRLAVYCDPGSCPGVAFGDRDDACADLLGGAGPCFYAAGGAGVGVWTDWVTLCGDPYCVDLRIVTTPDCGAGFGLRYGTSLSQGTVCGVCADPQGHYDVLGKKFIVEFQKEGAVVWGLAHGIAC